MNDLGVGGVDADTEDLLQTPPVSASDHRSCCLALRPVEQSEWDSYNGILLDAAVISRTDRGDYLLARDMGSFTLDQLNQLLPWPLPESATMEAASGWQSELNKRLRTLNKERQQQLNLTLEELFTHSQTAAG